MQEYISIETPTYIRVDYLLDNPYAAGIQERPVFLWRWGMSPTTLDLSDATLSTWNNSVCDYQHTHVRTRTGYPDRTGPGGTITAGEDEDEQNKCPNIHRNAGTPLP